MSVTYMHNSHKAINFNRNSCKRKKNDPQEQVDKRCSISHMEAVKQLYDNTKEKQQRWQEA